VQAPWALPQIFSAMMFFEEATVQFISSARGISGAMNAASRPDQPKDAWRSGSPGIS